MCSYQKDHAKGATVSVVGHQDPSQQLMGWAQAADTGYTAGQ